MSSPTTTSIEKSFFMFYKGIIAQGQMRINENRKENCKNQQIIMNINIMNNGLQIQTFYGDSMNAIV
ncbi:MAG: hypothetical protein CSB19_02170 [Clostridiales bacterium]|nr:MAG: hypothetical protein CSB19_02170 [Clostridiales bacterium]